MQLKVEVSSNSKNDPKYNYSHVSFFLISGVLPDYFCSV